MTDILVNLVKVRNIPWRKNGLLHPPASELLGFYIALGVQAFCQVCDIVTV